MRLNLELHYLIKPSKEKYRKKAVFGVTDQGLEP